MNQVLIDLGKKFRELEDKHADLTRQLKIVGAEWDECESELREAMLEDCVNSFDVEGIGSIKIKKRSFLSVTNANKEGFYKYLQESGHGSLLKLDVNPRTLTSFLRDHLEELTETVKTSEGLDEFDANNKALEFLKERGASYFTETKVKLEK